MRALPYQELCWDISPGRSREGLVISAFDNEAELFDASREDSWAIGSPIDLAGLLGRTDLSTPRWTQRQIPSEEAQDVGRRLWDALPPSVKEPLTRHGPEDPLLRLKVSTGIQGVADLPWEWLVDGDARPFALQTNMRLVRTVPVRFPVSSLTVEPPLNLLLLVPNPKDERLLNADYEIRAVIDEIPQTHYNVSVLEAPLLEGLREALGGTEPPHILHYIGHGGLTHGDGNLIFQDADRRSRWVDAVELAQLLPSSTRLLCLSTPFTAQNYQVLGLSHLARALGLVTLPTTITNQYPVREASVRAFWGAFYNELAEQDGNVNEAMHEAQRSAAEADLNIADWASFSLVVRDQTGVSFDLRRSSVDPHRRRGTELAAQFSAQLANDLASQVQILGEDTPKVLREQYEAERVRTDNLLSELEEA